MKEWNIKEEDNCKLKTFSFGLILGMVIVLLLAWDKIIYVS
ncbi:MAG: hypothetical protein PHF17_05485 [Arcobacteraceae bacterium]|jgi:hypothetical protein|nr:hypothetical protein [Arcobacteraceae bacterium]